MSNSTTYGSKYGDFIVDFCGDNIIYAGAGDDVVITGYGDDVIRAGAGDDIVFSGGGDDVIKGGSGIDILLAGSGDDRVNGGKDSDYISGGSGNDRMKGGADDDLINGGDGIDRAVFTGNISNYTITHISGSFVTVADKTGDEGTDYVINTEYFVFNDVTVSLDDIINGDTGNDDGSAPEIEAADAETDEDSAVTFTVTISDIDGDANDAPDISAESGADVSVSAGAPDGNGGIAYEVTYTPKPENNGLQQGESVTDTLNVTVTDAKGNSAARALTVTINGAADAPVIAPVPAQTVTEDEPLTFTLTVSDADINDGGGLTTLTSALGAGLDILSVSEDGSTFEVAYNQNGVFDYLNNGEAANDTVTAIFTDNTGETGMREIAVTVNGVADAPRINAEQNFYTTDEDSFFEFEVTVTDPESDAEDLTFEAQNGGVVTEVGRTALVDGSVTYTLQYDTNGAFEDLNNGDSDLDIIKLEVTDSAGNSAKPQYVDVNVTGVTDGPQATYKTLDFEQYADPDEYGTQEERDFGRIIQDLRTSPGADGPEIFEGLTLKEVFVRRYTDNYSQPDEAVIEKGISSGEATMAFSIVGTNLEFLSSDDGVFDFDSLHIHRYQSPGSAERTSEITFRGYDAADQLIAEQTVTVTSNDDLSYSGETVHFNDDFNNVASVTYSGVQTDPVSSSWATAIQIDDISLGFYEESASM